MSPRDTHTHGALYAIGSGAARVVRTLLALPQERKLAAGAALGLFVTLFLPWFQETVVVAGKPPGNATVSGWQAFTFVEAAVLLVSAGVLTLLYQRAEGRAFHLPGGDGLVITAAGLWTCFLVVWRMLDKSGSTHVSGLGITDRLEWGIFVALAGAVLLTYSGSCTRRAKRPEPPLPDDEFDFSPLPRRTRRADPAPRRGGARPSVAPAGTGSGESAAPAPRSRRRRRSESEAPMSFPAPAPLSDPPTLKLGDDEQLKMPFDDVEQGGRN